METRASRDLSARAQHHDSSGDPRGLPSRAIQAEPGTKGERKVSSEAAGAVMCQQRPAWPCGAHLELLQVGGSLPVLVVADAGAAREADGDAVSRVRLGLGELGPRDLPHWGFLHTQGGKHVTSPCSLSSQLQVSHTHSLSTPARFHLHKLTFLLTLVRKRYFFTKPEILH